MCVVKQPDAGQQITQPRSIKSVFSPFHLSCGTSPRLLLEQWPIALGKLAVEICVVSNDNHGVRGEGGNGRRINPMPKDHLVCDACEVGDLRGYWILRLVER